MLVKLTPNCGIIILVILAACSDMGGHTHIQTDTPDILFMLQTLLVTLHKPATDKAVHWDESVIDNEHLGKKTSKCQ